MNRSSLCCWLLMGSIALAAPAGAWAQGRSEERSAAKALSRLRGKASWRKGHVRQVDLRFNERADEALTHVGQFPLLEALNLSGSAVTDATIAHIGALRSLTALDLSGTAITDDALQHVARLRELRRLSLRSTKISDAGLDHLRDLSGLTSLDLGRTAVAGEGLRHLAPCTALRELSLAYSSFDNAGLKRLLDLPHLESVVLDGTAISDAGLEGLRTHPNLPKLQIQVGNTAASWGPWYLELERDRRADVPDAELSFVMDGLGRIGKPEEDKIVFLGSHVTPLVPDAYLTINTQFYAVIFEGVARWSSRVASHGPLSAEPFDQLAWGPHTNHRDYIFHYDVRAGASRIVSLYVELLQVKKRYRFDHTEQNDVVPPGTSENIVARQGAWARTRGTLVFDGKQTFDLSQGKIYLAISPEGVARQL